MAPVSGGLYHKDLVFYQILFYLDKRRVRDKAPFTAEGSYSSINPVRYYAVVIGVPT
jgi:hypothetical protein